MNSILFSFRQFHNWEEKDVAKELAISIEEYKNLECGIDSLDEETAIKLSELYLAPLQIFLSKNSSNHFSIIYSNCSFENSNGYVNHLYHHEGELAAKEETIKLLKEELRRLREENDKLMKRLLDC